METLEEVLKCPVCMERLKPPILLCENEHAICEFKCGETLIECPVCQGYFYNMSNAFINRFLKALLISSPVSGSNNINELTASNPEINYEDCNYDVIKCFRCQKEGIIYCELAKHLSSTRCCFMFNFTFGTPLYCNIKSFVDEIPDQNYIIVEKNSKAYFYPKYYVDVKRRIFYVCVQYLGKKKDANNFLYKIKFIEQVNLSVDFVSVCSPYFVSNEELKVHPNVLIFDMNKVFLHKTYSCLKFQFRVFSNNKKEQK